MPYTAFFITIVLIFAVVLYLNQNYHKWITRPVRDGELENDCCPYCGQRYLITKEWTPLTYSPGYYPLKLVSLYYTYGCPSAWTYAILRHNGCQRHQLNRIYTPHIHGPGY